MLSQPLAYFNLSPYHISELFVYLSVSLNKTVNSFRVEAVSDLTVSQKPSTVSGPVFNKLLNNQREIFFLICGWIGLLSLLLFFLEISW